MEVYNKLRNSLILLGFNSENGKCGIRVMMYIIITLIMYSNCMLHMTYNWENFDSRINDLKGFAFFTLFFLYLLYFLITWNDFHLIYSIIMKGHDYEFFRNYISDKQNKLLKKIKEEFLNSHNIMYYAIKIYVTLANLFPLIGATFIIVKIKILGNGKDKNLIEELPLLYPFCYPSRFQNLFMYFTAYLLQCIYMTFLGIHGYITYSAPFNSMQIIAGNIKLLRSSIEEFESILVINNRVSKLNLNINTDVNNYYEEGDEEKNSSDHGNHNENSNPENDLKIMKYYLIHIIKQHQIIYSKVNVVNKGIQTIAFTLNFGASIYVCFSVCFIIQKDGIIYKLIEGCLCVLALYIVLVFDFTGEKIITEWEYLRTALYNINWINKPQQLKKELLIIITRNNRGIEIKPYGLFVLNLKNFCMFINAVYSYYTLLNTIKNK